MLFLYLCGFYLFSFCLFFCFFLLYKNIHMEIIRKNRRPTTPTIILPFLPFHSKNSKILPDTKSYELGGIKQCFIKYIYLKITII